MADAPLPRPPSVHHCTSEPYRFFGRDGELRILDEAFMGGAASVVALVGPGGQGKTAILQHWLQPFLSGQRGADGVFLWSFYRGHDAGLCLRSLYAYAETMEQPPDVAASWCVDRLLPILRRERWALILDGTEVVQHDQGPWHGRFLHPELGRLLEELASEPLPGVVLLTSRFPLPELERRHHARTLSLAGLDNGSARALFRSLGADGSDAELDEASSACGHHAKAVELLATFVRRFLDGKVWRQTELPALPIRKGFSSEERNVLRILSAFQSALAPETQDILALTTAFREPPTEERLLAYFVSAPVQKLLHDTWQRGYAPLPERPVGWLQATVQELIDLRLLERVGRRAAGSGRPPPRSPRFRSGARRVGPARKRPGARRFPARPTRPPPPRHPGRNPRGSRVVSRLLRRWLVE